ncbi:MAG TPA: porin family protein [Draconibacterium sp.]|nr:porin family protein [Draconibacterium sp.]
MIRNLLIPAIFILLVNVVSAQRFEGGIMLGYNATQVEGDTYRGYNKPGFLAGAYVQTDLAPAIFAGMEIKYSQKGSRNRIKPKDPDPKKYIMRLNYIDIPFFIGFRTNERGAVIGGISAGYLLSGKEFDEYGQFPREDQNAFNNLDLQPFLGFQFDMLDRLKLDLRFALSVLPIRGQPGDNATNYYWLNNQFNNVISLAAYYRLDR